MDENPLNPEEISAKKSHNFLLCKNCGAENLFKSKYCSTCGTPLKEKYIYNPQRNERKIGQTILFFVAMVVFLGVYGYTELFTVSLATSLWMELALAVMVLSFAAVNYKEMLKLYSFKNVTLKKVVGLSFIMIAFAFIVNICATYINKAFLGAESEDMLWLYRETDFVLLLGILFIGFHPAIFEEMAFRGFLFNNLLYFSKPRAVIITTGILFAFIHFSYISLLWLLPIGLFFGYLRYRYRNLWYSTICHLVYNSTLVFIEYFNWL